MGQERISPEVQRFLSEYVRSVAQLELLLMLRTNPEQGWTVQDLTRELRVEAAWGETELRSFVQAGLAERTSASDAVYRYRPVTSELERTVTAVAQAYLAQRVTVIEWIYGRSSPGVQAFADAFRFRKEPPRG